jgi:hypothetical protein
LSGGDGLAGMCASALKTALLLKESINDEQIRSINELPKARQTAAMPGLHPALMLRWAGALRQLWRRRETLLVTKVEPAGVTPFSTRRMEHQLSPGAPGSFKDAILHKTRSNDHHNRCKNGVVTTGKRPNGHDKKNLKKLP